MKKIFTFICGISLSSFFSLCAYDDQYMIQLLCEIFDTNDCKRLEKILKDPEAKCYISGLFFINNEIRYTFVHRVVLLERDEGFEMLKTLLDYAPELLDYAPELGNELDEDENKDKDMRTTPLQCACAKKNIECVKLLIHRKASLRGALGYACLVNCTELVKLLLSQGAKVSFAVVYDTLLGGIYYRNHEATKEVIEELFSYALLQKFSKLNEIINECLEYFRVEASNIRNELKLKEEKNLSDEEVERMKQEDDALFEDVKLLLSTRYKDYETFRAIKLQEYNTKGRNIALALSYRSIDQKYRKPGKSNGKAMMSFVRNHNS